MREILIFFKRRVQTSEFRHIAQAVSVLILSWILGHVT